MPEQWFYCQEESLLISASDVSAIRLFEGAITLETRSHEAIDFLIQYGEGEITKACHSELMRDLSKGVLLLDYRLIKYRADMKDSDKTCMLCGVKLENGRERSQ